MRLYKLFLGENDTENRLLFSLPQNISTLAAPLSLTRESQDEIEPDNRFKKKSEVIEQEEDDYKELKEREKAPYILVDAEQKMFTGRLQDTRTRDNDTVNDEECYYVFINMGESFNVMPIGEWYRFTHKAGYETLSLEEAEQKLAKKNVDDKWIMHKRREAKDGDKEIDYEETFDDDEAEDEINFITEEEKELDNAGEEMKKIVRNYEKESSEEEFVEKEKKKDKGELDDEKMKMCFTRMPMSVKDLLNEVRRNYNIEGNNKDFIRNFIKRECIHKRDVVTNEKILYLKGCNVPIPPD